jgi:hypothetical protein
MIPESFEQLRQDNLDRSAYRRTWNLCMTLDDVAAFSDALKAAFPAIRFVSREYWSQFCDQKRIAADQQANRRRIKRGLPSKPIHSLPRDPQGEPLRYWNSLADPAETRFIAWIEPPGWQPIWMPPDEFGGRYIDNTPRLWFDFNRCHFLLLRRRGIVPRRRASEPKACSGRTAIAIEGNTFEVRWNPLEPEAEAFAKKVYNILRKLTVDRFIRVEPESRRAFEREAGGMRRQCLAGHHAVAWAMRRRHNYFGCNNWNVLLKPANYPFGRRDILTKAERRRQIAAREKGFEEEWRLRTEALEHFRAVDGGDYQFEWRGLRLVAARLDEPWETYQARKLIEPDTKWRVALELKIVRRGGRAQWREVRPARS